MAKWMYVGDEETMRKSLLNGKQADGARVPKEVKQLDGTSPERKLTDRALHISITYKGVLTNKHTKRTVWPTAFSLT